MDNSRKTIRTIQPSRHQTFDQQFWPVLIALAVLLSIALGAAVTLLRGPWMWTSLLVLPSAAAVAIALLYKLDHSRLRRSLQLAIIFSLAAHLVILIVASMTSIFQNEFERQQPKVAQRQPKRAILVRERQTPFIWQQPNLRETPPDPEVETEREETSTNERPQPVPIEQPQKEQVDPQVTRRETPSKTVPRLDQNLSQLRRQERNLKPKSSQQARMTAPAPKQATTETMTEAPAAAKATNRQSAAASSPQAQRAESSTQPAEASPTRVAQRNTTARPEMDASQARKSSASTSRIRRWSPRIPTTRPRETMQADAQPQQTERPNIESSRSLNQLTRRQAENTPNPNRSQRNEPQQSRQNQVSRLTEQRSPQRPSISSPTASPSQPRRSTVAARTPTTTRSNESPARHVTSQSQSREMNAREVSVARGESGIVGARRGRNMDRGMAGAQSPAIRASDAASRRETRSQPAETQMLSPSLRATERRSIANAEVPSSAFRANSSDVSRITGSRSPSERTVESSAASVTASTADHRSQVTAQRGQSSVDLGPTKIVPETATGRRSGGGQTEVARLNPDPARRASRQAGERVPEIIADAGNQTAAQTNATTSPSSEQNAEPNANAMAHARDQEGTAELAASRGASSETGEPLDRGEQELGDMLADSRQRAESNEPFESGDGQERDPQQTGNNDRRLAQAPVVNSETRLRSDNRGGGVRDNPDSIDGDALASEVVKRAAGALAGSVTRGTTGQIAGTLAAMPLVDVPPSERASRGQNRGDERDRLEPDSSGARSRSEGRAELTPSTTASNVSSTLGGTGTGSAEMELEANEVAVERQGREDGLAMRIDAPEGPAGIGDTPSTSLGIPTRPASRNSTLVQPDIDSRFRRERFGGNLAVNPDAALAKQAFRSRNPAAAGNAEPSTEAAIQLGLEFLARHQQSDGRWSLEGFDREHRYQINQLQSDTAATGLALLAFQGAGYNHKEFKYAQQVNHALQWLIENQEEDGDLYVASGTKSDEYCQMYSHAIAALALCEAYGMTQDPDLFEPTQRAIDWIQETQDPKHGGWRYYPQLQRRKSDTSVTGWMMMALQSGRLAGFRVRKSTLEAIDGWMETARDPNESGKFRYNPYAEDTNDWSRTQGRDSAPPMTAVGLLIRIYSGWPKDDPRLISGAQSLVEEQLAGDQDNMVRDTYYWYYATQVLKHLDGDLWTKWNGELYPLLIQTQEKQGDMAGSWHPYEPVPDRWGLHAGRLYVTTMNLLSLEVRYRLLPLYEETIDE